MTNIDLIRDILHHLVRHQGHLPSRILPQVRSLDLCHRRSSPDQYHHIVDHHIHHNIIAALDQDDNVVLVHIISIV